ncbi:MAG: FAD-dependent oxidoreductase, partial [Sphaerochaetaceae bacterium]
TADGVHFVDAKDGQAFAKGSMVLVATGRKPNLKGFEALQLATTKAGVVVDEYLRTNIPNIYAIGDVNGKSLLAHSASRMAEVVISNLFGSKSMRMRYHAIPWAVYGIPEAAGCGLTETDAQKQKREVLTAVVQMRANGRFLAENGKRASGLCKIIVDAHTRVILGVHLLGPYSSEIIPAAAVMIEAELRIKEAKEIIYPHPSVAEIIKDALYAIDQTV